MDYKNVNDYEVIYMIRENDDMAELIIYDKYRPLVKKIASKYFMLVNGKITFDDLVQEGFIGVSNAIKMYDENSDVKFFTFLSVCVERRLLTYCRNINSNKHYILNNSLFDTHIEEKGDFKTSCVNILIENEDFINMKHSLEFIDSNIIELKYNGFTYIEIAQLLDIPYRYLMYRIRKIKDRLKLKII